MTSSFIYVNWPWCRIFKYILGFKDTVAAQSFFKQISEFDFNPDNKKRSPKYKFPNGYYNVIGGGDLKTANIFKNFNQTNVNEFLDLFRETRILFKKGLVNMENMVEHLFLTMQLRTQEKKIAKSQILKI